MKTLTHSNFFNLFNKQRPLCITGFLPWLRSLPRDQQSKGKAEATKHSESGTYNFSRNVNNSRLSQWTTRLLALVGQGGAVHNLQSVSKTFPRIFVGLVLLVVMAPYADIFYTRLDFNDRVSPDVWYYESFHWLFLCLGPYIKGALTAIAYYLIFNPRGNMILAPMAAYGLMYDLGKIFWLLQVTNHDEYKSLPTNWYLAYGFAAGLFIVLMADKLTYWFHHRYQAIKQRLHGLRNIVGKVDNDTLVTKFTETMDDDVKVQQFIKQY